jgi:pyruvate-ferredoxin/flavodoxin oxidoreductase
MKTRKAQTMDGNEAVASVAYRTNEFIAIYPITPASTMAEWCDQWASEGKKNLWGDTPRIVEMQSEGGAAGTLHGAVQNGMLGTTFTSSQGLLLMIPNMYKMAGERMPAVIHVAARSLATSALSIFGDHSDVMAVRGTGFGMLFGKTVQEAADMALIAQVVSLKSTLPFLNILDGFRTSHEVHKLIPISDEELDAMLDPDDLEMFRDREMSPEHPVLRGTAHNPDTFFQIREAVNPWYESTPGIVTDVMTQFAKLTGRSYSLFDYEGAPDAERVIIVMGSAAETVADTVAYMNARGENVGVLNVRLFRPFSAAAMVAALPASVRSIAVLDRTKEPGSAGEPLYQDVVTAFDAAGNALKPLVISGRYGLSSKEFTPGMVMSIFNELGKAEPKSRFTIGIDDDVTHLSLDVDPTVDIEPADVKRAIFWGLGADGTVGANKNSIKIIGEQTDFDAQGYFVYDSKKSGSRTVSHLRFGHQPIRAPYLVSKADFIAVHQFGLLDRVDTLEAAEPGATFLLNSPYALEQTWDKLPSKVKHQIREKQLKVYVVDAYKLAKELGLGSRINTIMQTCHFAISGVLPADEAIKHLKTATKKTYGKRGDAVVQQNFEAIDRSIGAMSALTIPDMDVILPDGVLTDLSELPEEIRMLTLPLMSGKGDSLPVSAFPTDGTWPTGTAKYEKRQIALELPVWNTDLCIQCGKCVMACPHSVIRAKVLDDDMKAAAPDGFGTMPAKWRELTGMHYTLQISADDCTGCTLCEVVCPVKDKAITMVPAEQERAHAVRNWEYFQTLPDVTDHDHPHDLSFTKVKDVQLLPPYFEFPGACAGCGETPYLKLITQLYGDRMIVANATGCSSIYGGNLPTTPWSKDKYGRGPAWNNSLFEDNAEFGLGMRLAMEVKQKRARTLLTEFRDELGAEFVDEILNAKVFSQAEVREQRKRITDLKIRIADKDGLRWKDLLRLADVLVEPVVWIIGGDGWAYDIGYGGLDHVMAGHNNVNIMVLDTEVYSNTGGQSSKSTGLGAIAKFAAAGKEVPKKDLAKMAMAYGYVYVARIAMGADENHALKAIREAVEYDGPSLIIAYGPCIAHGLDMAEGPSQQEKAVKSGYWPLFRYDPRLEKKMQIDSKPPSIPIIEYLKHETRFKRLIDSEADAEHHELIDAAQEYVNKQWEGLGRV